MKLPGELRVMSFRSVGAMLKESAAQWSKHRAASKGAALALYMIFSLAPMLILVIAVAGFFFGEVAVQAQLVDQLRDLTGERGAEVIQTVLASAHESNSGIIAAMVSIGVLIFSATTAFAELQASLDDMWEVEAAKPEGIKGFVRTRFASFGLVLVLALFLLISLSVNAGLAAAKSYYGTMWAASSFATVADLFANLFAFSVVCALFAVIYKLLPSTKLSWRDVVPGAIITAILFLVGKYAIGLYLGRDGVASSYGAAGSVVALLLWIYYSAQIFFMGAVITRQFAERFGTKARHAARMDAGTTSQPIG
ncbi:YihY/virulence factor BrkB family protein [Alcaligenaceae bacterium A4P071]|nr:YihY/virulence factor BrkB family protein [Alcaligenaceae bacterium B3P038]MDQ2150966.1 YihY/virulence factor BrkB family protein [Alcaligenaceae bacterium C4P045]MDQ2187678.1 YihY/virulence factor BrkB family protein [Alcaligenaceae bacterium A4P071]